MKAHDHLPVAAPVRPAHGRPFARGFDARRNTAGRGVGTVNLSDVIRRIGAERDPDHRDRTRMDRLMRTVFEHAEAGEPWAVAFVAERAFGKVKDTLTLEHDNSPRTLVIYEEIVSATDPAQAVDQLPGPTPV